MLQGRMTANGWLHKIQPLTKTRPTFCRRAVSSFKKGPKQGREGENPVVILKNDLNKDERGQTLLSSLKMTENRDEKWCDMQYVEFF